VRVRRLGIEDAELAEETLRALKGDAPEASSGDGSLRPFLARPENILIVADEDGAPIGFLVAYALDRVDRSQKMMCLYEIEVLEARRRRGVGRAMVEELIALSRRENAVKVWVVASRGNAAAMRLYTSAGARAPADDDVVFVYEPPLGL
jgi:ribosomal protein S18 acetylase RimI-like enzyme